MHVNAYRRLTEEGLPIGVIRNQPLGSILLNDNTEVPLYLIARLVVEIFNEEKSSRANWRQIALQKFQQDGKKTFNIKMPPYAEVC